MKRRASPSTSPSLNVQRLAAGASLVLSDAETMVIVVRGSCAVRGLKAERVEAGTVLVPHASDRRLLDRKVARGLGLLQAEPAKRWTVDRLARVGYTSEFAFSRAFKRQHGVAPGSFRRLRRNAQRCGPMLAAA